MGKIVISTFWKIYYKKKKRTASHKISRSAEAGNVGQIIPQLTFWWSDSETNRVNFVIWLNMNIQLSISNILFLVRQHPEGFCGSSALCAQVLLPNILCSFLLKVCCQWWRVSDFGINRGSCHFLSTKQISVNKSSKKKKPSQYFGLFKPK